MKKRQGSVLAFVLIIFAMVMVFGTVSMTLAVNENNQSIRHENKTKAYYIARSGAEAAEAAILGMGDEEKGLEDRISKIESDIKKATEGEKDYLQNQLARLKIELKDIQTEIEKIVNGNITIDPINIDGKIANIILKREGNNLSIVSTTEVDNSSYAITKVLKLTEINEEDDTIDIEHAVFASGDMTIRNGTIYGDIGTNSNIRITGGPTLNGSIYSPIGSKITFPDGSWKESWEKNYNKIDTDIIDYERPSFLNYFEEEGKLKIPKFPHYNNYPDGLNLSPNLKFQWDRMEWTIDADKRYEKIEMVDNSILTIDTRLRNINIWTEEFNNIYKIRVVGNNDVNIHVKSKFSINSNSSPIIIDGNIKVNIYYSGKGDSFATNNGEGALKANLFLNPLTSEISINNASVDGNIYIYQGKLSTSGGSNVEPRIKGDIYSKNGDIGDLAGNIHGDIYIYNGNLSKSKYGNIVGNVYQSIGETKISGSGLLKGSLITGGSKVELLGAGKIAEGLVYAPNADVKLTGSGSIEGALISKTLNIDGGSRITYRPEYIDTSLVNGGKQSSTQPKTTISPGYYK